jgi:hypothetical protein
MKWENLLETIRRQEISKSPNFKDEQIWTFLIACGYALSGEAGLHELTKILTGSDLPLPPKPKVWLEALPLPPRQKEGNTNVDLALGTISIRRRTKSGIELEKDKVTWVCFCEMKFNSDIARKITHDNNRNQLLRVIENALCFQNLGKYAEKIYVSLVTPEIFRSKKGLQQYREQFEKYRNNAGSIEEELDYSCLQKREQSKWHYPEDISERINKLHLNWVSYEELFSHLPVPSESGLNWLYQEIKHFWEFFGLSPEDWYQGLLNAEESAGGVLSYTPLMKLLESPQDNKRVALQYLPLALSCALQNDYCLQDIKNASKTYPDLIPDIVTCAINLRKDKLFSDWTKYESNKYKDFIVRLEDRLSKKR